MKERLNYLMSGSAHLPYLLASLRTLRYWYHGEVMVHAWPESFPIVKQIAEDERLDILTRERTPEYRGKNCQFVDKLRMIKSLKDEVDLAVYIDADTTFHGPINRLFDKTLEFGFAATQFNDWKTNSRSIQRRLKWLEPFVEKGVIDKHIYLDTLSIEWPSVNGGVWGSKPSSLVLDLWEQWTWEVKKDVFIADEVVLHTMMPRFKPTGQMTVLEDGAYNCSPKYKPKNLMVDSINIMHYHGDSNVRPDKSEYGHRAWWPIWQTCLKENIGNVQDWKDQVSNKWMKKLEK